MLHAKRPRLIPIFDRTLGKALDVSHRRIWEAMSRALRDPEIRQRLHDLQAGVYEAREPSLLCVLDIVVWTSEPVAL